MAVSFLHILAADSLAGRFSVVKVFLEEKAARPGRFLFPLTSKPLYPFPNKQDTTAANVSMSLSLRRLAYCNGLLMHELGCLDIWMVSGG